MLTCAVVNKRNHSFRKSRILISTSGGMQGKYVATVCVGCKDAACVEHCPTGALTQRAGGGVKLDSEKCAGCRTCVGACTVNAVFFDEDDNKPLICTHCGICARYCPHDCMALVDVAE